MLCERVSFWKLHGILVRRKVVEKPMTNHRQTVENATFGVEQMLFCIDSWVAKQVRRTKSVPYENTSGTTSIKRWANRSKSTKYTRTAFAPEPSFSFNACNHHVLWTCCGLLLLLPSAALHFKVSVFIKWVELKKRVWIGPR
jgi:hypothetical protein